MVSIIMTTHNHAEYIKDTIESVLDQSYSDIELIIVDDNSNDETKQIIEGCSSGKIRYMRSSKRRGEACSRNVGIRRAKGEYIAIQEDNIVWEKDKLSKQIEYLNTHPECGMVCCRNNMMCEENGNDLVGQGKDDIFLELIFDNRISLSTIVIRKEVLQKVGLFDENMEYMSACEWLLRVAEQYKIVVDKEILTCTNKIDNSIRKDNIKEAQELCTILYKYKNEIIHDNKLDAMLKRIRECIRVSSEELIIEKMIKDILTDEEEDIGDSMTLTTQKQVENNNNIDILMRNIHKVAEQQRIISDSINGIIENQRILQEEVSRISTNQYAMDCSIENLKYEIAAQLMNSAVKEDKRFVFPQIEPIDVTVDKLIEGKSICRFGDGEFAIMAGNTRHKFQQYNVVLSERLKEVIESRDNNILIAIADMYGDLSKYNQEGKYNIRAYLTEDVRRQHYELLDMTRVYSDAYVSRPYTGYLDNMTNAPRERFKRLKEIWDKKRLLIIEGEKTRMGVGNDLFDNAAEIIRILGPAENAFERYDDILECAKQQSKEYMVLIAMSATATVMAYDLARLGFQAIDIGHIDLEYEWMKAGIGRKIMIRQKYNNEMVGGDIVEDIHDEKYEKQIIAHIV